MNDHDLRRHNGKRAVCPDCREVNDDFTPLEADLDYPKAGNISICGGCDGVAMFTGDGLEVRALTDTERVEVLAAPEVQQARFASMVARTMLDLLNGKLP